MTIARTMEIRRLKREARRLYLNVQHRSTELDCGAHLAEFIRPDIARDRAEFTRVMDRLRAIDPEARALPPLEL